MAGVDHDAIKYYPLLCQTQRELEVRGVSGMVEVHCDRHRRLVRTGFKSMQTKFLSALLER